MDTAKSRGPTTQALIVMVTGLSGAGRSTAISALEDLGFSCMDSLPFQMVPAVLAHIRGQVAQGQQYFAIGIEAGSADLIKQWSQLKKENVESCRFDHVHLNCDESVIRVRYSATRRKHPFAEPGSDIEGAIALEKAALETCRELSDVCFDTSHWSPHQLARALEKRYSEESLGRSLNVQVTSFGFKHGLLSSADSISDVRFLVNPHFVPDLSPHTGLEKNVRDFLEKDATYREFCDRLFEMYKFLIPHYYDEGKHYLQIGIGCTGGKHRSVAITEELAKRLNEERFPHVVISTSHRDMPT